MIKNFLRFQYLAFAIILSFFAFISLLHPGLPPTHDGEYHIIRFYEFTKVILDGNWYPRWAPDLNGGFGVPLFNYVYPLPNYIAFFLHAIGFSFINGFKASIALAGFIGAVFFYLWVREFFSEKAAAVASLFYTFSPYHFVDIYIRGSIGEIWALAFFPLFLFCISKLHRTNNFIYVVFSGISLALIILSHNILGLMFFIFVLTYMAFLLFMTENRKLLFFQLLFVIVLGLSFSAIFWMPALVETQYVRGLQLYVIKENFPETYQLLIPSWGSGFFNSNLGDQMSVQIGIANIFAVCVSLFIVLRINKKNRKLFIALFFLVWFFLIFFLMTSYAFFVWQSIPLMNYFQFPWRFLSLEILIASFLAGFCTDYFTSKIFAIGMIVFVFLTTIGYAKPAHYLLRNDKYYLTRSNFIDGTNSPGNLFNTIWIKQLPTKRIDKITFANHEGKIIKQDLHATQYTFTVIMNKNDEATLSTAYFPGWTVFIDERIASITPSADGFVTFPITQGNHKITVLLKNTTIRNIAQTISFISVLLLLLLFYQSCYARIKR